MTKLSFSIWELNFWQRYRRRHLCYAYEVWYGCIGIIIRESIRTNYISRDKETYIREEFCSFYLKLCFVTWKRSGFINIGKSDFIEWIFPSSVKTIQNTSKKRLWSTLDIFILDSMSENIFFWFEHPCIDFIWIQWVCDSCYVTCPECQFLAIRKRHYPSWSSFCIEIGIISIFWTILTITSCFRNETISKCRKLISCIQLAHSLFRASLYTRKRKGKTISIRRKCISIVWTVWELKCWCHSSRSARKCEWKTKCHGSSEKIIWEILSEPIHILCIYLSWIILWTIYGRRESKYTWREKRKNKRS